MMLFNPIISLLHNVKLNRWHPIIFVEAPLPGPPDESRPVRHKSKGHHTEGFSVRDEAVAEARKLSERVAPNVAGAVQLALAQDLPWDGEGVPASVALFVKTGAGELVAALG